MKPVLSIALFCGTVLVCGLAIGDAPDNGGQEEPRGEATRKRGHSPMDLVKPPGLATGLSRQSPLLHGLGSLTVQTVSGRRFTGEADARSDANALWLRSAYGRSSILRPIRWDRVVQVELGGRRYTSEEFRTAVQAVSATYPRQAALPGTATIRMQGRQREDSAARAVLEELPPVQSVALDVRLANWDGDVEADGLVVEVQPRDGRGMPVPAEGTLWVNLVGRPTTPVNRPAAAIHLGRWSTQVRLEDFGPDSAVYRFPFRAANPASHLNIAPNGLVNVRLSVPGQGVFEATQCSVRLRPSCSFRDELFLATGRWYLPLERIGQ